MSHTNLLNIDEHSEINCASNFYCLFNFHIETDGGNTSFKSKSVGKPFEIREFLDLSDILKVKNRDNKRFTFR